MPPPTIFKGNLLAGSVYISSQVDCAVSGGLAEAFWVFVVQDIQFALAYQKPLRLTFRPFDERLQRSWQRDTSRTDRSWIQRVIWLLAETIHFCYSNTSSYDDANGIEASNLKQKIRAWDEERPNSFNPLFCAAAAPANGKPFPMVWYTNSWHGGLFIDDPVAQDTLLQLPRRTEEENGWPWSYIAEKLGMEWGMRAHEVE
ncbi:hypothetical protein VTN00DRAFT_3613 [Thermoascus crustaceus]|uniref:uncharacterized protein n=1 Tax=Thermoascus crustaceus TaxID=5088 RepID=UPI003742849B